MSYIFQKKEFSLFFSHLLTITRKLDRFFSANCPDFFSSIMNLKIGNRYLDVNAVRFRQVYKPFPSLFLHFNSLKIYDEREGRGKRLRRT